MNLPKYSSQSPESETGPSFAKSQFLRSRMPFAAWGWRFAGDCAAALGDAGRPPGSEEGQV